MLTVLHLLLFTIQIVKEQISMNDGEFYQNIWLLVVNKNY